MKINRKSRTALWRPAAVAFSSIFAASAAVAASQGEFRQHEAHEHGHGTLDIVLEGEELVVELRIPAVNVVGFEHAPHDDAEHAKVREALATFEDPASVLVPAEEAECEVEAGEAVLFSMEHDEHDEEGARHEDDDHESEAEGHGHDEDEAAHADEEGHEDHEEHAEEVHSELRATYHFHCHEPDRLVRIEVRAFEHLLDAEEIEVRVVTPGAQTATELHPGETVVELVR